VVTGCGVAVVEGRGTVVLGLVWATAVAEAAGLFQGFQLNQDGVDQPLGPPAVWQPAKDTVEPITRTLAKDHRDSATRMAGNPQLASGETGSPVRFRSLRSRSGRSQKAAGPAACR
jgi:hypothetical protein